MLLGAKYMTNRRGDPIRIKNFVVDTISTKSKKNQQNPNKIKCKIQICDSLLINFCAKDGLQGHFSKYSMYVKVGNVAGQGHCVVFLGKTIYSQIVSLYIHTYKWVSKR